MNTGTKKQSALIALLALIIGLVIPLTSPTPAHAVPTGAGRIINDASGGHWLGANLSVTKDGKLTWCVELGPEPIAPGQSVTIDTLTGTGGLTKFGPPELRADNLAQIAWILDKYESVNTADSRAAISTIMHSNLEVSKPNSAQNVMRLWEGVKSKYPAAANLAISYMKQAKASGVHSYSSTKHTGEEKREGTINNIGIKNVAGKYIAGIPYTLTLKGPAVFAANGKSTLAGNTANQPITVKWQATGNGKVSFSITYKYKDALNKLTGPAGLQRMIANRADPSSRTVPGGEWKVIYDFQPIATSKVTEPSVAATKGEISDTIKAFADPKFTSNPKWIDGAEVNYKGEVYYMGETLPTKTQVVPAGAKPVATTSLKFTAPGEQTATVKADKPGFYTWVWSVDKGSQKVPEMIHANWTDGYTVATETQVKRIIGKISSKNNVIKVHSGSDAKFFLNDWVKVEGFPANHTTFAGYGDIKADHKTIDQYLYCVPSKTKLAEGVTKGMTPVKSWNIPAENGNYRIADYFPEAPGEHIQDIDCRGTLVFVSEFAGDDRVEPLRTSELDPKESFVPEQPSIHTTATDKADGDKYLPLKGNVTIKDVVTYRELAAGKEYTLQATLMDKATGKPFQDCGKPEVKDYSKAIGAQLDGFKEALKKDPKLSFDPKTALTAILAKADKAEVEKAIAALDKDKVAALVKDSKFDYDAAGKMLSNLVVTVDKIETGKNCKPITATKKFTPAHRNGTVEIDIPVKAELLAGKTTVVFEDVLREGKEPIVHHDINDKHQTVYSPDAKTTATDGADGDKTVTSGRITIKDKVEYKSLIPGGTYTIEGKMMDKTSKKPVNCMSASPVTFKASASGNGTVAMTFKGNCQVSENTDWVVFETIIEGKTTTGKHVVEHHDIDDVSQTVTVVPGLLAKTGSAGIISLLAALLLTGAGAAALYARKRAIQ